MTTRTTITLPDSLMSDIDRLVGPRGRSSFLVRAAQKELKREQLRLALDAARGVMVGKPGWRSGDEIIAFVDRLRTDDRDPWVEHPDNAERE
jgi:Arc/MetJ-type ribon-helix-helix transcriptional regulator